MKTKAAKLFSSIKYELLIFVLLCIQALSNLFPFKGVDEYIRLYYLVDFSIAKTTRLLVGSIVSLFNSDPTPAWINGFATAVLFAVLLLTSVLVGKVIRATKLELRNQLFVFVAFWITGIFTMSNFSEFLGMLDIWLFLVALLSVACAFNKYLHWLVPVFCAVGVFIHNGFAVSYFPLIILVVFYVMVTSEKKAANAAVFALSAAVTVALSVYVTMMGHETATVTSEQLFDMIRNKGGYTYDDIGLSYMAVYLLRVPPEFTDYTMETVSSMSEWEWFVETVKYTFDKTESIEYLISTVALGAVILGAFWVIWIKCMKNTESKSRRFVYFCFMAFTLFVPLSFLIATDYARWIQAGVLNQFALVMIMFAVKDEPFEKTAVQLKEFFKDKKLLLFLMFVVCSTAQLYSLGA